MHFTSIRVIGTWDIWDMGYLGQGISKVVSEKVLVALGLVFFGTVGTIGSNRSDESDESDRSMGLMGLMGLMGHMGQGRAVRSARKMQRRWWGATELRG